MKAYTDLEQSKVLADILPVNTADMTYYAITDRIQGKKIIKDWEVDIGLDIAIKENLFSYRNGYVVPCWSLGALLEAIPHIIKDDDYTNEITPLLYPMQGKWFCVYNELDKDGYSPYAEEKGNTPIEAVFNMIVWLFKNEYIKKSKNECNDID